MILDDLGSEPSDPMRGLHRLRVGGKGRGDEAGRNGADKLSPIHHHWAISASSIGRRLMFDEGRPTSGEARSSTSLDERVRPLGPQDVSKGYGTYSDTPLHDL